MMRECHLQLSGPWPPYHFVHRLTRGAHAPAPAQPVATPAPAAASRTAAAAQLEPVLAAV
jgi:hypothetical protein